MDARGIWGRLLWKELRESAAVLLVGTALPLLALGVYHRLDRIRATYAEDARWAEQQHLVIYPALAVATLLLIFWAIDCVRARGPERFALPVPPAARALATYLLPAVVPVAVGLAMGALLTPVDLADLPGSLGLGVLYALATFTFATVAGQVLPVIPVLLLGVAWLFLGFGATLDRYLPHLLAMIGGTIVLAAIWPLFARRQRYLAGRIVIALALLGLMLWPFATQNAAWVTAQFVAHPPEMRPHYHLRSYTHACFIIPEMQPDGTTVKQIVLQDYQTSRRRTLAPPPHSATLALLDRFHVLLGQRAPRSAQLTLYVWETERGTLRKLVTMPTGRVHIGERLAIVNPDGTRALLAFASPLGRQDDSHYVCDLWAVDFARRRAALALPAVDMLATAFTISGFDVAWTAEGVRMINGGTLIDIDFRTLQARKTPLPIKQILRQSRRR